MGKRSSLLFSAFSLAGLLYTSATYAEDAAVNLICPPHTKVNPGAPSEDGLFSSYCTYSSSNPAGSIKIPSSTSLEIGAGDGWDDRVRGLTKPVDGKFIVVLTCPPDQSAAIVKTDKTNPLRVQYGLLCKNPEREKNNTDGWHKAAALVGAGKGDPMLVKIEGRENRLIAIFPVFPLPFKEAHADWKKLVSLVYN